MTDQWVKLTAAEEADKGESLYVNLAHAISIWPNVNGGSRIWYIATGEMSGSYDVMESPEEIFKKRDEIRNAYRP